MAEKKEKQAASGSQTANYNVQNQNDVDRVRQLSRYSGEKCAPDNNPFFEERSNPLSSKGN